MRIGTVSLSLLLATALTLTGNALLSTLAAVRLADAGVSEAVSGWVLACYFAGLTAGTLVLPPTIRRVGHVRAFAAVAALGVATAIAHAIVPPGWAWALLRGTSGLAMAGVYMTVESWLNADARAGQRGRVMAAYLVALYLGGVLGQLLLPLWPETGIETFAVAAFALSLAVIPVSLTRVPAPSLHAAGRMTARELLRLAPLGWLGASLSGFVAGTLYANVPLAARSAGLSTSDVSLLMTGLLLGGLAGQWPIGWLSDRMDRRLVLLGVPALLTVLCLVPPSLAEAGGALQWILPFVFGALAFSIYPLAVAHTLDRVGEANALAAAAQTLLASSVGAILGPVVAAAATGPLGRDALFVVDGLVLGVFTLAAALRVLRVAPVAQEPFLPVPRTTPVVHELDPRT